MSCINCTQKAIDEAYEAEIKKAYGTSQEQKAPMAVYQEEGEWKHCNAFNAYQRGLGSTIRTVVSAHNGVTAE